MRWDEKWWNTASVCVCVSLWSTWRIEEICANLRLVNFSLSCRRRRRYLHFYLIHQIAFASDDNLSPVGFLMFLCTYFILLKRLGVLSFQLSRLKVLCCLNVLWLLTKIFYLYSTDCSSIQLFSSSSSSFSFSFLSNFLLWLQAEKLLFCCESVSAVLPFPFPYHLWIGIELLFILLFNFV